MIKIDFKIGGGSIPPSIPVTSFCFVSYEISIHITRIREDGDSDDYLRYANNYCDFMVSKPLNMRQADFVFYEIIKKWQ